MESLIKRIEAERQQRVKSQHPAKKKMMSSYKAGQTKPEQRLGGKMFQHNPAAVLSMDSRSLSPLGSS